MGNRLARSMTAIIRPAGDGDLPAILAIYNDAVRDTTAVWNDSPVDLDNRRAWLEGRHRQDYPVLVAVDADRVVGYGSFGDFRAFDGYRFTVEHSIYVAEAARRRGIASALLVALVERATALGKHVMVAGIAADNAPSIALHLRHGFTETGRMPEVGYKFGRWLDLVFMQKRL
ncbi:phosphinothricin acetyltransferase [Bauldia litoralis]|uniref:Phosphinothricin acetyltransferase n=2 Tax=Bauldia litoralis TaxID=665467 RepID=A0A1G6BK51_9HYPH|nr:phosphinothricin acetyltransferase [Bauldia litoralis]